MYGWIDKFWIDGTKKTYKIEMIDKLTTEVNPKEHIYYHLNYSIKDSRLKYVPCQLNPQKRYSIQTRHSTYKI